MYWLSGCVGIVGCDWKRFRLVWCLYLGKGISVLLVCLLVYVGVGRLCWVEWIVLVDNVVLVGWVVVCCCLFVLVVFFRFVWLVFGCVYVSIRWSRCWWCWRSWVWLVSVVLLYWGLFLVLDGELWRWLIVCWVVIGICRLCWWFGDVDWVFDGVLISLLGGCWFCWCDRCFDGCGGVGRCYGSWCDGVDWCR